MHGRCLSPITTLPFDHCCVLSSMCCIPHPNLSDHRPTPRGPRRSLSLLIPSLHPPPLLSSVKSVPPCPLDAPSTMRQGPPILSQSHRPQQTNGRGHPRSQEGRLIACRCRPRRPSPCKDVGSWRRRDVVVVRRDPTVPPGGEKFAGGGENERCRWWRSR
jgi:hypothetical protein